MSFKDSGMINTAVNGTVNYASAQREELVTFNELDGSLQDIVKRIESYSVGGGQDGLTWIKTSYVSNRGTNAMTISAEATDSKEEMLTYMLYWNGSTNPTQTKTETKGREVTFDEITGLTEYTTYTWKVEVTNEADEKKQSTGSERTYCSGTGVACSGGPVETCKQCLRCRFASQALFGRARLNPDHRVMTRIRSILNACFAALKISLIWNMRIVRTAIGVFSHKYAGIAGTGFWLP